jgi:hypothetical protein
MDAWETADVREFKPEDIFRRFQNLRGKDFKPESLRAYEQRFKQALESFLKYVDDPANWKAPGEQRSHNGAATGTRKRVSAERRVDGHAENEGLPPSAIKFEVPIPGKGVARFIVPADISEVDLEMMNAVLHAYVKRTMATAA